jgi:hypothetical protein
VPPKTKSMRARFFNIYKANAFIKKLFSKVGKNPDGAPQFYNHESANSYINKFQKENRTEEVPDYSKNAPTTLAPKASCPQQTTSQNSEKLCPPAPAPEPKRTAVSDLPQTTMTKPTHDALSHLPKPAAAPAITPQAISTAVRKIGNFAESRQNVRSQLAAHVGEDHAAVLEIYADASPDAGAFMRKALARAEADTKRKGVSAMRAAANTRLGQVRAVVARGERPQWTEREVEAMGRMIFVDREYNLTHRLNTADDKMAFLGELFHGARLSVPGWANPYKPTPRDEHKAATMDPKTRAMAQQMIADFQSTYNGTQAVERFDAAGSRSARAFIREQTGGETV